MSISQVISLLSGVAMFLFGMSLMGDGLKKVSGNKLEPILFTLSSTPLRGVLLGTGVTAVIQSSCATSVMVVGFVNAKMMKLRQAISVILGAILGTSITGWIICLSYIEGASGLSALLSTATLTGIAAIAGILLRMFSKKVVQQHIGDILLGFAVLMFGMSLMSSSVRTLGDQPWFLTLLSSLSHPILGILAGAAFTALLQSASASVGIIQALSLTGVMTLEQVLPLLMGVSIGASLPVLLSALGANVDGKRTALVYLIASLIGTLVLASLFYVSNTIFNFSFMNYAMNPVRIAFVNTILRLLLLALLIPFMDVLEAVVKLLIPEKTTEEDPTYRLEERFLEHPALAIEQSRLTIQDMAEKATTAMSDAIALLTSYSDKGFEHVKKMEDTIDKFEDALGTYLVKLNANELTEKQSREVSIFLHTLSDFERISDHALNIAGSTKEINEKGVVFSPQARAELVVITTALLEVLRITKEAFLNEDDDLASHVEPLEEVIDNLVDELKSHHIARLQHGQCTILQGFVFNDLLSNFERVSDHCSNIGVAIIELKQGSFDTHQYLGNMKKARTHDFDRLYKEYSDKYSVA